MKTNRNFLFYAFFVFIVVVIPIFVFLILNGQSKSIGVNLHEKFFYRIEVYRRILLNTILPIQKIEISLKQKKFLDENDLSKLENYLFILTSGGIKIDYLIVVTSKKEILAEIQRGAITRNTSDLEIFDENEFADIDSGFFYRACKISNEQYLCIIQIPDEREFSHESNIKGRLFSVVGLDPITIITDFRNELMSRKLWSIPLPSVSLNLGDSIFIINRGTADNLIIQNRIQIDKGTYLEIGYSLLQIIYVIVTLLLIILALVVPIYLMLFSIAKRKASELLTKEILIKKTKDFDETQQLIRGFIHDIKSPIAALVGLSAIVNDTEKKLYLDRIIKRLSGIISDLQRKKSFIGKNDYSLFPVANMLNVIVEEKNRERGCEILSLYPDTFESSPWIKASYSEILRMMSNLINNAIEAVKQETGVITIDYKINHNRVIVYIKDNGHGINSENLEKIFNKDVTIGKKNGSGYGLYHAKKLVESLGGNIGIKSNLDKGTTVSIELETIQKPKWWIDCLDIRNKLLVVADDENFYEHFWKEKTNLKVKYYSHPSQIPVELVNDVNTTLIMDLNFGQEYGLGIDYLTKYKFNSAILVTNDWTIGQVQSAVCKLNVFLYPKDFLKELKVVV